MVLMEYLAFGKPVLAGFNTHHKDSLRRKFSPDREPSPSPIQCRREVTATWSVLPKPAQLQPLTSQATEDMRGFSWSRLAQALPAHIKK
jgi:hypothetical protein